MCKDIRMAPIQNRPMLPVVQQSKMRRPNAKEDVLRYSNVSTEKRGDEMGRVCDRPGTSPVVHSMDDLLERLPFHTIHPTFRG